MMHFCVLFTVPVSVILLLNLKDLQLRRCCKFLKKLKIFSEFFSDPNIEHFQILAGADPCHAMLIPYLFRKINFKFKYILGIILKMSISVYIFQSILIIYLNIFLQLFSICPFFTFFSDLGRNSSQFLLYLNFKFKYILRFIHNM